MAKKFIIVFLMAASILAVTFYWYTRGLTITHHSDLARDPLETTERENLRRIHLACFEAEYKKQLSNFYAEKFDLRGPQTDRLGKMMGALMLEYWAAIDKKFQSMKNLYVVKLKNVVIGEFSCSVDNDFTNGNPILFDLCLDKDYRGQGYGAQMTEVAIEKCSEPGKPLVLTVYKDQPNLVKMYEGLGFQIVPFEKPQDDTFKFYNKHLMRYARGANP